MKTFMNIISIIFYTIGILLLAVPLFIVAIVLVITYPLFVIYGDIFRSLGLKNVKVLLNN